MSTVFETAIRTLFANPNLARDATYIPQQGNNRPVRIIVRAPDVFANIGDSVIDLPTLILEVQVSECPNPAPGDHFLIGQNSYVVQGEPRRDSEQLTWQVDLHAS
jgi:hypothetical protein